LAVTVNSPDTPLQANDLPDHQRVLDAGGTIVTATQRQADYLKALWGRSVHAGGAQVWDTPRIVSYANWLEQWHREDEDRCDLLERWASLRLWQRIIAESPESDLLLSIRATAEEAERTYGALQEGGITPAAVSPVSVEEEVFTRWALAYETRTRELGVIDHARLAGWLARHGRRHGQHIGWHGFETLSPARRQLLGALTAAEGTVLELTPDLSTGAIRRLETLTPDQELDAIVDWLDAQRLRCPDGRFVVIVPDLTARRQPLERRLAARLGPLGLQQVHVGARASLAESAIVDVAMMVLELGGESIDLTRFGQLLRSPYLEASEPLRQQRTRLDLELRRHLSARIDLTRPLPTLSSSRFDDPALKTLLAAAQAAFEAAGKLPAGEWADRMQQLLRQSGWPKGRTLQPHDYQCARAFTEALAKFGRLSHLLPPMSGAHALSELRALIAESSAPTGPLDPHIWILDRLEDPGLPCDGLWVAGLTSDRFPKAPTPLAFLSIGTQRRAGVPGVFSEQALGEATRLLERWSRLTRELVLSVARQADEETSSASALIGPFTPWVPTHDVAASPRCLLPLETVVDPGLAPLPAGTPLAQGARLVELQQACPFRATGEVRLKAHALSPPRDELSPQLRGEFAHLALKHFWLAMRTRERLAALDEPARRQAVRAAIDLAATGLKPPLPDGELARLERLWLEKCMLRLLVEELERPSFEVVACEQAQRITVAGHPLDVRIDRIDRVGDDTVLIDYKTGNALKLQWQDVAPDPVQLPFYAAWQAEPPTAIALAMLPQANSGYRGLAGRAEILPKRVGTLEATEWASRIASWQALTTRLILEYASGAAPIAPLGDACQHCALSGLCRIDHGRQATADGAGDPMPTIEEDA